MGIHLKNPGVCVICGATINPALVALNPAVDVCGRACGAICQRMPIPDRIVMIRDKFVPSHELDIAIANLEHEAKFLDHMQEMMRDLSAPTEDYMRPMGVEPPAPSPVFKPMKPSASIFITGETDEEVAQHVLMVCWGTAAK